MVRQEGEIVQGNRRDSLKLKKLPDCFSLAEVAGQEASQPMEEVETGVPTSFSPALA
jgi:hypothetical protein